MSDLSTKFIFSLDANQYTVDDASSIVDVEGNYTINQTSGYLVKNDGRISRNYIQRPNTLGGTDTHNSKSYKYLGTTEPLGIAGKGTTSDFNRPDYGIVTTNNVPSTTNNNNKTIFNYRLQTIHI